MGQLGFSEMLVIFIVALLVFGPKKLPELGKSLGKGIREFRKATDELKSSWEEQVKDIKAPLDDVKRDIHSMGQDLKTDLYNSLESTHEPAHSEAPATLEVHQQAPGVSESKESTAPKEHV